jgi:hypothetical protein
MNARVAIGRRPGVEPTRVPFVTPVSDHEIAHLKPARSLLKASCMGAPKLRLVTETIDLDEPEVGLDRTLDDIASDLQQVRQVRRDVRSWALVGAAASSGITIAAVGGLLYAFMPGPPPPQIVIQPAPVAVVVSAPAAQAPEAKPEPKPAPVTIEPAATEGIAPDGAQELSEVQLAVRRAFSALWASRPKAALREADAVLAANPNQVDALAARALALYDLKRDRAARAAVKKALMLKPSHPLANVLRGTMAQVDHDLSSALAHYDKYLKAHPSGALADELSAVRQHLTP